MAVTTSNKYGKIVVSDEAVAMCAHRAASECYGVMALVSKGITDRVSSLRKRKAATKGVKVTTIDNRIFIDLYVVLKEGVLAEAVSESLRSVVTYSVESFTGMRVKSVNVHVVGTRA